MNIKNFTPRPYQISIIETCKNKNTLVCVPTGLGKTKIAILLAIEELNKYPETKALILTPTKPLANQICNEFKECTDINPNEIVLLTGFISPKKRIDMYNISKVIVATPQTIEKDVTNNRISLNEFSLLVIDEAHRSRERFANTIVAKYYIEQAKYERILALTASPGSTKSKIEEVCKNLYIEAIEIRTEKDEDISEFIQSKNTEYINVELPEEIKFLHSLIKGFYKEKLEGLRNFNINKPTSQINKVDILFLQRRLQNSSKNSAVFYGLSLVAQLLKLNFAMELIETQGINSLNDFFKKLELEETKAAKIILKNQNILKARMLCEQLLEKSVNHPKINKLKEIIKETLENKKDSRIIIFATYRNTVDNIMNLLNRIGIKTTRLVGQKEGLSQKEQIETIKNFNDGVYNCLVATSIAEEGLHIEEADVAIFYDNTPSSIRKIQRAGRVGRLKPGRIIFMITKGTRDSAYYWKSKKDEIRMKSILYGMKEQTKKEFKEKQLTDF